MRGGNPKMDKGKQKTKTFEKMYLEAYDIGEEELEEVTKIIKSKKLWSSLGDEVKLFEESIAKYQGMKYTLTTSSETTALSLSIAGLGIGPGDEVAVPACSSLATPNSVVYQNAVPIFVDINPRTFNISPEDLEKKLTERTKAVIVVHMYGCPAEIDSLLEIARRHNLFVIEDCALAMGAEYKGRKVGTFGDIACFSFGVGKQITVGEGGAVATNNERIAKEISKRNHHYGTSRDINLIGKSDVLGYNYKLGEVSAAIGLAQLKKIDMLNNKRIENSLYLTTRLKDAKGIITPYVFPEAKHVFNEYVITIKEEELGIIRDQLWLKLLEKGVPCDPLFDVPMNLEPSYRNKVGYGHHCPFECPIYKEKGGHIEYKEGLCPTAEKILPKTLAISPSPGFKKEDLDIIVNNINSIVDS